MPGAPLSLPEREEINVALIEDRAMPWAEIGRRIDRDPTTVSREVARHGGRHGYRAAIADGQAAKNRGRPRVRQLAEVGPLRDRVRAELKVGRSPYAIWADLIAEGVADVPCVETIYSALFAGALGLRPAECLRSRRRRRRCRQARPLSHRPDLPTILDRPADVNDRSEPGHWEADHFIGKGNGSAMMCLTERSTRFSLLITMPDGYTSHAALAGLIEGLEQIPPHLRRSITFDQGPEWAQWPSLIETYSGLDVFFCEPHSPWQRGQIENLNRQWRWWFPRGTELAGISPAHANEVAGIINGQRRRLLDNQSPTDLYAALTVR